MSTNSRREHDLRLRKVLLHIDRHLAAPLDLPSVAAMAHFSPFHFHRVFAAWMGETLGDYLRRRRLEVAAMRLLCNPRLGITEAALDVGFGSGEAFARAFRLRFGAPPSAWRQQRLQERNLDQVLRKIGQAPGAAGSEHEALTHPPTGAPMNDVTLHHRDSVQLACLRYVGPYGPGIGRFWRETMEPWLRLHGLMDSPCYGIGYDDPSITDPAQCRYDAGVQVPPGFVPSGGAMLLMLPAGRHAELHFRGTPATIGEAWNALFRDWLPDSGFGLAHGPCFERYPPAGARGEGEGFECDICIPVVPLGQ
ncbi:AraC family transcriptional regulator [Aquincola tertiaricarbonis]|uniref:AraC family transcriptional regulator n=1 Tax=Aquincola tertiaricarbonis TaxID=391953 RepID=UPI000AB5CA9A|nr:AraC family transcriptional regulator [Aquincola tertiaricarbonis]